MSIESLGWKVVNKEIIVDPETYNPSLRITIDVPLAAHLVVRPHALEDELSLVFGRELAILLAEPVSHE